MLGNMPAGCICLSLDADKKLHGHQLPVVNRPEVFGKSTCKSSADRQVGSPIHNVRNWR
jgi:hypothetical protein